MLAWFSRAVANISGLTDGVNNEVEETNTSSERVSNHCGVCIPPCLHNIPLGGDQHPVTPFYSNA